MLLRIKIGRKAPKRMPCPTRFLGKVLGLLKNMDDAMKLTQSKPPKNCAIDY